MPSTIVIGPVEHLPALQARGIEGQTRAFEDTDALGALDAITKDRPDVVLIERGFADTPRGAALVKRIKADPALTACSIRVVGPDGRDPGRGDTSSPVLGHGAIGNSAPAVAPASTRPSPAAALAAAPSTTPATEEKLDQRGTRRAPRTTMPDGVDVQIDGNAATLIDLSSLGAQVVSPTSLKPSQRIRLVLPDPTQPARCRSAVVWAAFEIPKGLARYRAGIEFVDADQTLVARFVRARAVKNKK